MLNMLFKCLYNPQNSRYILSVVLDNIATSIIAILFPLFILDLTHAPIHLSFFAMIATFPYLILGLQLGTFIDNFNIQRILYISDIIRFICYIIIGISVLLIKNIYILLMVMYFLNFVLSVVNVLNTISEVTFLQMFVEKNELINMNSIIFIIQYVVGIFVPMIGGCIYNFHRMPYVFMLSSFLFLASSLSIYRLKLLQSYKNIDEIFKLFNIHTMKITILDGFEYLKTNKMIFYTLVFTGIYNFFNANFKNDYVTFLRLNLNYSTDRIGLLSSIFFLGSIFGVIAINKIFNKIKFQSLFLGILTSIAIFKLTFVYIHSSDFIMLSLFTIALCGSMLNMAIIVNRQKLLKVEYLGRINSIYKVVLIGIHSLGFFCSSLILYVFDVKMNLQISICFLIMLCFLVFYFIIQKKF